MMKTEILPYTRTNSTFKSNEKATVKSLTGIKLSKTYAILLPFAFLLGRASLAGGLMPFGMAFYASTIDKDLNRVLLAVTIVIGMITGGAREQLYVAIVGMLLFNAFNLPFKNIKTKLNFRYSVIAFISVFIPQMVLVYLQGFLLYDCLKALLQSFIVFSMIFIFRSAVQYVNVRSTKQTLSNEELISGAIAVAVALSGLGNIGIMGFNLKNILCILVIIVFSYKCGSGVGTSIGVTIGILVSMSSPGVTPLIIGSYAFCGLLAGVFRSLGKIGSCLGFIMGNTVLTLYLNGSTEVIIFLKEIILAIIIFLLIPEKLLEVISNAFGSNLAIASDKSSYSSRIKEITMDKLNKFSRTFKELSKTFSEISETKVMTDKRDISQLFDKVADKVCRDCSLCLHCWDRNFYTTYQALFIMVEKLERSGRVDESDIPEYFLDKCERVNDFMKAVNNSYEVFKVDMMWKNKVGESRELISQQLDGISDVISKLANEIDIDVHFKADVEDLIFDDLNKIGLKITEVIVYENKWGKYEINIFHRGCGGKRTCLSILEKRLSALIGRKMVKEATECCTRVKNNLCSLRFIEEEVLSITTGVAKLSKYEGMVSGDSYTFMSTGDGKYIVALSDGMGSGQKAATQSRATISLLEQFMESGFDKDITVKIINSILVLRSNDDSFSTIDMTIIDLYEGETEFVKVGAVPTFIKKQNSVEVVRSASMPAGILSNVETELIHKKIISGDFIIMMSDGIIDSFNKIEGNDKPLLRFIEGIESINPQEIADIILNRAYENCEEKPIDDMIVLVAKVWKRI
jgi:stage II sporulation protein E